MMVQVKGACGIVLGVLTVLMGAGLLASASYLVSLASLPIGIGALTLPIVAVRFFGIGRAVCRYGERYLTHAATMAVATEIRTRLYGAAERLSPVREASRTDVARSLVLDADVLQEWYVRMLTPAVTASVTALVGTAVLYMVEPVLAGIYLGGAVLMSVVVPYVSARQTHKMSREVQEAQSALADGLTEMVLGLTDARLFGAQDTLREEQMRTIDRLRHAQVRVSVWEALMQGASELASHLTVWLIFVGACICVSEGRLQGVWLAAVVIGVSACMEAFLPMVSAVRYHDTARRVTRHMAKTIGAEPLVRGTHKAKGGDISFDHVTYEAGGRIIADDVTFTVRRGEHIALVGASGSGKTTLLRLLYGYLRPSSGRITVGGIEVGDLADGEIESIIAPIPQEIDLFAGTLADNVRLADPSADEARLCEVWQKSEADDLPPERTVAALGRELSGGQRQRIAIARYLLTADRDIALWDEPLAHLSADTAARLHRTLMATRQNQTLLLVTHRLEGLADFDRILVLDGGRIVEQGTEQDLLARRGHYARLKRTQADTIDMQEEGE